MEVCYNQSLDNGVSDLWTKKSVCNKQVSVVSESFVTSLINTQTAYAEAGTKR